MAVELKDCRVEVICEKSHFMMFDFGLFGIAVTVKRVNAFSADHEIFIYSGDNYHRKFSKDWYFLLLNYQVQEVIISGDCLAQICEAFERYAREADFFDQISRALKRAFPQQFVLFGHLL